MDERDDVMMSIEKLRKLIDDYPKELERLGALKEAADEIENEVDGLAAELEATKAELKLARGVTKTVLNNTAAGKMKIERERRELDRRLAMPHDKLLVDERDRYKGMFEEKAAEVNKLNAVLDRIRGIAQSRELPGGDA